jgi:predicted phage-related endonuclease
MNRKNWPQQRRTGISSSDAAAACGRDPRQSAYEMYMEKTREVPHEVPPPKNGEDSEAQS